MSYNPDDTEIAYKIPTYNHTRKTWEYSFFYTDAEYKEFVQSCFKKPGKYEFDDEYLIVNEQARNWKKNGFYCDAPFKSKDFIKYWDDQKLKCKRGLIIIGSNNKTWYVIRDYYMWLNFLPIFHKEKRQNLFPDLYDGQYHTALYEHLGELNYKHAVLLKKRQYAMEQPHSARILAKNGWETMGSIKIGDEIWNPDGTLQKVIDKLYHGRKTIYNLEFANGSNTDCGIDHLWYVWDSYDKKYKTLRLEEIINTSIYSTPITVNNKIYNNYRYYIDFINPIQYEEKNLLINPYVLGCILGDGHINTTTYVCGIDLQIFSEIQKELGKDYIVNYNSKNIKGYINYKNKHDKKGNFINSKYGYNPLTRYLKEYDLLLEDNTSKKQIPTDYKKASIKQRIALIQGMMDTDGYINSTGKDIHFTNTNYLLINDFVDVCRSLGLNVSISKFNKAKEQHQNYYRVRIKGNINFPLFRLQRKLDRQALRVNKKKGMTKNALVDIKRYEAKEECSCIVVSNPNHLYITDDYIVTHNSYYHMAKLINQIWFEEGVTLKLLGYNEAYINLDGSWAFLNEYRDFLNKETAWYRPFDPDKVGSWTQRFKININGRDSYNGNKSRLIGITTQQSPTKGVGGACLLKNSLIYRSDYYLDKIQNIKEGDYVLGKDNLPKKVLKCFTGYNHIYKVEQTYGEDYFVTENHLLHLWNNEKKEFVNILAKDFNNLSKNNKEKILSGVKIDGLNYNHKNLKISPYWLGLWLGDGTVNKTSILVNESKDSEIKEWLIDYSKKLNLKLVINNRNKKRPEYNDTMSDYSISGHGINSIKGYLKVHNFNLSEKYIPNDYLTSSKKQRLELLAGIIDTDGHYSINKNRYEIFVKSDRLAKDIVKLAKELGFRVNTHLNKNNGNKSTVYKFPTFGNVIHISGKILDIPILVNRKKPIKNSIKNTNNFSKLKVSYYWYDEYFGFECEDNLFVLGDLTITHNSRYIVAEESGVYPTLDKTYGYAKSALEAGLLTVGQFIAYGSVGDLKQCEPLKEYMLKPDANGFFGVETDDFNSKGETRVCGLFIPETWNMLPYSDKYGNSNIEAAKTALLEKREKLKKDLNPEAYQLEVSQHPLTIEEAFAWREESPFPVHLVNKMIQRISDNEIPYEYVDLSRDSENKIVIKKSNKLPVSEFPISKKAENKEGVIVMYERPDKEIKWGTYYASIDPVGEGKAEHVDNMLYTPTGRKRIGDIQIGDQVIGSNGQPINVIGVYPQGIKKLCKITFSDGHSIKVCEDHLWNVKLNGGTKGYNTLSVKDLLDNTKTITYTGTGKNIKKEYTISTYYKDKQNRNKWSIPIAEPVFFNGYPELSVHPYLLGLLLGDGGLSQKSIRFSTVDEELITYIKDLLDDDLLIKKVKNSNCDYAIVTKIGSRNSLTQKLKVLDLKNKRSEDKHIPDQYMYSSIRNRLLLLQGLMDTDGSYSNHGAEFYSSSKIMAYQVIELVQSLGGIAKIRCKKTTHLDSYIVRVLLPESFTPFRLKRKRDIYKPSKVFSRYITNIEYIDDAEAICISVDAPDNLYVTEHALVTHNTTTSESLCSIFIYKNAVEISTIKEDNTVLSSIEGDKLVAEWCGRFDDINRTHERLELMIELYNAWTLVEANVGLFFTHMTQKNKTHYLVPSNQFLFNKELLGNQQLNHPYGWKNTGTIFKTHLLSAGIEFLNEKLSFDLLPNGDYVNIKYGIDRVPSLMLMKEMQAYRPGLNVDRLIAYCSLVAFVKIQSASRRVIRKNEIRENQNSNKDLYKLKNSPFKNIGGRSMSKDIYNKAAFKNLR